MIQKEKTNKWLYIIPITSIMLIIIIAFTYLFVLINFDKYNIYYSYQNDNNNTYINLKYAHNSNFGKRCEFKDSKYRADITSSSQTNYSYDYDEDDFSKVILINEMTRNDDIEFVKYYDDNEYIELSLSKDNIWSIEQDKSEKNNKESKESLIKECKEFADVIIKEQSKCAKPKDGFLSNLSWLYKLIHNNDN